MPVTYPVPPAETEQAVQQALSHMSSVPPTQLHALRGLAPDNLTPTQPHEVFTLGLNDLRGEPSIASSRGTGWRYLLRQAGRVVASAETSGGQFSQFNSGPFVAGTEAALNAAEAVPQVHDVSYELRLLHVPALYTMALWLHNGSDGDLLVPLEPAPPGVEANHPYSAEELLSILAERARNIPDLTPDDARGG